MKIIDAQIHLWEREVDVVAPHLLRNPDEEPDQLVSVTDITDGAVTIPKYRDLTWEIAAVGPQEFEELPGELQQALADVPDFGVAHYCGYGRQEPARVRELLADLATGADELAR